jgi:hypothetical protein
MFRRKLLLATALIPAAMVAACGNGATAATIDTQVLADATGIVNGVSTVAAQVNQLSPGKISASVIAGLAAAKGLVSSLAASTPALAGATTLQTVDNYISAGLTALAAVLPAAAVAFPILDGAIPIIDGAIALLPGIEAWVNPLITQVTAVSAAAPIHPIAKAMSLTQARQALGVATVK